MSRPAVPQIGVSEMARMSGLSPRRIRDLVRSEMGAFAKGEGRNAKVTVARKVFDAWMESRQMVRAPVGAAS